MADEDELNRDLDLLTEVFSQFMEQDESVSVMKEDKLAEMLDLLGLKLEGLQILKALRPKIKEGLIDYEDLVEVVVPAMEEKRLADNDSNKEKDLELRQRAEEAFKLFTNNESDTITLKHLRKIAHEIKDNVDEPELRDMLMLSGKMEVNLEDFVQIMKQAGGL